MQLITNLFETAINMRKAITGQGSRGGKVIGKTRSGKPIYESHSNSKHKNFTPNDHRDAVIHHGILQTHYSKKLKTGDFSAKKMRDFHNEQRLKHVNSSKMSKSLGEGSRGGKIIGHTSSGKPIYGSTHAVYQKKGQGLHEGGVEGHFKARKKIFEKHYPGWSKKEHTEARDSHYSGAQKYHKMADKEALKNKPDYNKQVALRKKAESHSYAGNQHGMFSHGFKKSTTGEGSPTEYCVEELNAEMEKLIDRHKSENNMISLTDLMKVLPRIDSPGMYDSQMGDPFVPMEENEVIKKYTTQSIEG